MRKITTLFSTLLISGLFYSQTLNPTPSITAANSIDTFRGGYTFAYVSSGAPWNGSLISFGGFSNNYDTQINADYGPHGGNHISFRTRNGDVNGGVGIWNSWIELATKGSNNFIGNQNISGSLNIIGGEITLDNSSVIAPVFKGVMNSPNAGSIDFGDGTGWKFYFRKKSDQTKLFSLTDQGNASLQGKFEAKEVKVTTTPTADFVFAENYNLPKLEEVEKHIKEKKHLPEIASAAEMEKEGVNVGEFQIKLLQKIEELTLYSIEQNRLLKQQQERIEKLEGNLQNK